MNLLLWIIFGGLAGLIASVLVRTQGGIIMDIVLGIVGALVGGFLVQLLGGTGITGFNLYSLVVAIVGAVVVVSVGRLITRG